MSKDLGLEELQRQADPAVMQEPQVPATKVEPEKVIEYADAENEPAPAPEPTEPKQTTSVEGFDDDYLSRVGIDPESARRHFRSQEALESAVRWQDEQAMLIGRQAAAIPPQQRAPQQQAAPAAAQQTADDFDPSTLDEQEWGKETKELLVRLDRNYKAQIAAANERAARLEGAFVGMHQAQQQARAEAFMDAFDARVNALPEQYRELFGEGDRNSLNQQSGEFINRSRLYQSMEALRQGRHMQGLPELSMEATFNRALLSEFPESTEKQIATEVGQKLTARFKQSVARPSSRVGAKISPEKAAESRVAAFLDKHAIGMEQVSGFDGV
jgi:hypothetical protein